jgi:parallel beta-helix repeat protein
MNTHVIVSFVLSVVLLSLMLKANPISCWSRGNLLSIEDETVVYVDPQTCYVSLGSVFRINVSVANVTGLFAYEFMLYYGTSLLDGLEVKLPEGHFLEPVDPARIWISKLEIEDEFNSTHGRAWVAVALMSPESGKNGSGILTTITFQVIKSGKCVLDLYEPRTTLVNDMIEEIAREVRDGYFESKAAEHEIAVFLDVPSHLVPGEPTNINAAVQNGGQNDETNIVLRLLIDGTMVDSTEISFLPVGSSHNLSYRWTPLDEAKYNVTAYAPSIAGENNTLNNVNSKTVAVSYVIKVPLHFPTIQEAIEAANPGDTIQVASGTYHEHLIIDKKVTLAGENANDTIIDGNGTWKVVQIRRKWMYGWIRCASKISGFTFQNGLVGVIVESHDNIIEKNTIKNCDYGIYLSQSVSGNIIRRNTIENNECGILCEWGSSDNMIYHNNLIDNTDQAVDEGSNTWDYSDEGNYWSDYNGTDTDEDNIGDASYDVNATEGTWDAAPLMFEYISLPGDLNDDGGVNMHDLGVAAKSFGSYPRHPRWDPAADIHVDGRVNVIDMVLIAMNFGKAL